MIEGVAWRGDESVMGAVERGDDLGKIADEASGFREIHGFCGFHESLGVGGERGRVVDACDFRDLLGEADRALCWDEFREVGPDGFEQWVESCADFRASGCERWWDVR